VRTNNVNSQVIAILGEQEGKLRATNLAMEAQTRAAIANQWFGIDGVDAIVDVATSSVALAVQEVAHNRNKVLLISGAAASDLTGRACSPTSVHWTYDTVALANGTGSAVVRSGGDTWFFITADAGVALWPIEKMIVPIEQDALQLKGAQACFPQPLDLRRRLAGASCI
jgi:ABC-type branched-subunit amino acid transport system substrate-binding protein